MTPKTLSGLLFIVIFSFVAKPVFSGVTKAKISVEKMAVDALASGSPQNNPRIPTADENVSLYQEVW